MSEQSVRTKGPLSTAVVEAVADAKAVDPTELSQPLYSDVDPETLDDLFKTDTGRVTFHYHGYSVTVHATGDVDLDPLDSE